MSHGSPHKSQRNPPLHIPLDFEAAIDGLLQVDPKQPVDSKREPEKKPPRKKKPGKRPGK
jgi:hypothetical protein